MNVTSRFAIFVLIFVMVFSLGLSTSAQEDRLTGPIVASSPIGGGGILFREIDTGRVWSLWTPVSIYDFFPDLHASSWSPDGCRMIILNMRTRQWALLNIMKMTISDFPDFLEDASIVDPPIWHPDSRHITVTFSGGGDGPTQIASLDYKPHPLKTLFAFDESGGAVAWLSPTELLYVADGNWLTWNADSQESAPFGTELFPQYWAIPAETTILHVTQGAPNFEYATRFYSPRSYGYALWQESFDGMSAEEFNELNERVRIPGFDLYDLNAGTNKHIDVNGEFLLSLEWSPSSSRIVVSTYPDSTYDTGNIFIYDLDTETLTQVDDFPALFDTEYGPYVPTWSSDEQWLAINTHDGYIAYNLLSKEVIELNNGYADGYMGEFTHTNMRLTWSPIMDYSAADCS